MKRLFGTPVTDYLPALVLWLLSVGYLVAAYGYSPDSRAMPVFVAWLMLALLPLDLASRTQTPFGHALTRWLNPSAEQVDNAAPERNMMPRQVAAVSWLAGFVTALMLIGVLYAVPLYVFASMRLRGGRSYLVSVAGGVGMVLTVWLLFAVLLRLQLYPGLLFGS